MPLLKSHYKLLFIVSISIFFTAILLYGFWSYLQNKKGILEHIDTKLYNHAISLKYLLPDDFHDRAIDAQAISIDEDKYIANKLTRIVKEAGFKYNYTVIKKEDKLFFAACDLIADPENERGTFYYYEYESADKSFFDAFDKGTPTYKTVSDKWGTFRTVMIPEKSPDGIKYLACADYDITYVQGLLQKNLFKSIATVFFFLLLSIPIIKAYIASYKDFIENLKESEEKFRTLVTNTEEIIYMIDKDGRFLLSQGKGLSALGLKPDEVVGESVFELYKDYPDILSTMKKAFKGESITTESNVGGIHFRSWYTPHKNQADEIIGLLGLSVNITDQKKAEDELKQKSEFLDKVIESAALSTWISDENGNAIRANPACLEFFGATEDEVIGKYNLFKDSVIQRKGFMPVVKNVFEKGKPASFVIDYDFGEVDHVDVKNATHKTIKTVFTPVLDNNKKVSNVIVQGIDITELKKSEEEKIRVNRIIAEHEKLSLVGQVAGKMAHDFNNILGIIMGNSELALVDCPDGQTKKRLELIYKQTIRGKNLTKNLVAFAKDQEPKQEFFSIDEKIDLVLKLLKKDLEGINVMRQYSHGIPELLADSGMIEHAMVNLIQNSIHAVSLTEQPEIIVHTYYQGEFVFIEIEDNGCGIPQDFIGDIYEPSFTLKGSKDKTGMYKPDIKGTGYGMSNVKKYIEQHKGRISIHSELQKGTKVTINLPVIKKELTNEEIQKVKKEKISFEKYILIVEDEQDISDVQYNILTHKLCNHKVDIASNGQVALDLIDRNEYDLISLDYVLPGKFNGMDVYNHVREKNKRLPILFISGNIEFLESIRNLKKKDLYIDHLSKPCKNIDYLNGINQLFENTTI